MSRKYLVFTMLLIFFGTAAGLLRWGSNLSFSVTYGSIVVALGIIVCLFKKAARLYEQEKRGLPPVN